MFHVKHDVNVATYKRFHYVFIFFRYTEVEYGGYYEKTTLLLFNAVAYIRMHEWQCTS